MPTTSARPLFHDLRIDLSALVRAALAAVDPYEAVLRSLGWKEGFLTVVGRSYPVRPDGALRLVAAGKASLAMTRAAVRVLGSRITRGIAAHPRTLDPGAGWPRSIAFQAASHPYPDEGSLAAGAAAADLVRGAGPGDLTLVLLSGGGSALLERPRAGVSLEHLRAVTRGLQRAGADIEELNTVRRALSTIKGGGLARLAAPSRVVTLALSDVVGDRPEAIASGPTVPSPTSPADAVEVLKRRGLDASHRSLIASIGKEETPRRTTDTSPEEEAAESYHVIGSNRVAAEAARAEAAGRGFDARVLTTSRTGEARHVGREAARMARRVREVGVPCAAPACLIEGGETTVTVTGTGRGGRNLEVALGAAIGLQECPRAAVFSLATDGVDGASDAAGAFATADTVARARTLGLDPADALARNDADPFFRALGDLWTTGPTGTNVNDLIFVLVYP